MYESKITGLPRLAGLFFWRQLMEDESKQNEQEPEKFYVPCPICTMPVDPAEHGGVCTNCGYRNCPTCGER